MPLIYDDSPGSWGRMSEGWPEIIFDTPDQAMQARYWIVQNEAKIPYGSYVSMSDRVIRLETQAYVDLVREAVNFPAQATYRLSTLEDRPPRRTSLEDLVKRLDSAVNRGPMFTGAGDLWQLILDCRAFLKAPKSQPGGVKNLTEVGLAGIAAVTENRGNTNAKPKEPQAPSGQADGTSSDGGPEGQPTGQ